MEWVQRLVFWYEKNGRNLPWRETRDPYKIWISEVILQQTRVIQGLPYYHKFLAQFPTLDSLAHAQEQEVLHIWQGLGYYSRARNLHTAAKEMWKRFGSDFPTEPATLQSISGIGPYTAAAIVSFAFEHPTPVVDGNVYRVFSRFWGIDLVIPSPKAFRFFSEQLQEPINNCNASTFNQATMELGALVCLPLKPLCANCPLQLECYAFQHQKTADFPQKKKNKSPEIRHFHYLHFELPGEKIALYKRTEGIWKGLHEFPCIEFTEELSDSDIHTHLKNRFLTLKSLPKKTFTTKHQLTHRTLFATFWKIKSTKIPKLEKKATFELDFQDIHKYPIHRLMQKYLDYLIESAYDK